MDPELEAMIAIFRSTGKFRSGLTAVRVRSGLGTALLSPNRHLGAVLPSVATKRMTIGRLMLLQAVASAEVRAFCRSRHQPRRPPLASRATSAIRHHCRHRPGGRRRRARQRSACGPSSAGTSIRRRRWPDKSGLLEVVMIDNRARNGTLGAILGALIAVAFAVFLLNGGEHVGKKTVKSDADLPPVATGQPR
jgi:hypothetical protein